MPQALSPNHLTMPPAPEVHLLPAAASDIPRMVDILIAAFSPGPWSSILFPPRLRSTQRDESDWRIQAMSEHLGKPGHRYVVARQQRELEDVSGTEAQSGNYVVGWAHWRVATARDEQRTTEAGTRTAAPPRGLDIAAYEVVVREGKEIEKMARAALGVERWSGAIELGYIQVEPEYQRQGIGRLLAQEGLDCADIQGKDVWLRSTPEGRGLYLSLGFQVVGQGTVIGQSQFAMVRWAKTL